MKKVFLFVFLCFFWTKSFCIQKFYLKDIFWNIKNDIYIYKYNKILLKNFGDFIEDKNIINVINCLYNVGYFDKVKVYKLNKKLYIYLHYKSIINNILIQGNNTFNNVYILNFLKKFNIKKNSFLNDFLILKFKYFILDKYRKLNKYNVKINFSKFFFKKKYCNLKINFNEGKNLNVKNILFKDNLFLINNSSFLKIFNSFINFNLNNFILNLNLIKNFYFNYGYLDFNFKKIKFIFLNNDTLNIKIYLYEGNRYKIHDLLIYSNKNNNLNKKLNKIKYIFFYKNMYYKYSILKNIFMHIKDFLKKNGFLDVNIDLDYQKLSNNKIIFFLYVKLGKIYYINKVFLRNISLYENNFLYKNNIPKLENNLYNEYLINLGKLNLEKTNFFTSVSWKKQYFYKNKKNKLNIIYFLEKNNDSKLNFGINYGKINNLNYELSLFKKNFFYLGNDLLIKSIKDNFNNYNEIYLINPINYINNFYIKQKLFYNYIYNNNLYNNNYINFNYGYKNNFIWKINNFLNYKFGIHYICNNFYKKNINSNLNNLIKKKIFTKDYLIINNLNINKLNSNILPKYGFYIDFNSKFTLPNSYNNYYKIYVSLSKYFSLNKNYELIFFVRNYIGYGNGFKNKILPFYENFNYLENNFLRVFNGSINYNKNILINKDKCNNYKCILYKNFKGNLVFSLTNELIFPNKFIFLNKNYFNNIRTSLFIDSGFIIDTIFLKKLYLRDFLKISTGISFKFVTFLGTINLSYGFPLVYNENDRISNFQFSIGNYFN